MSYIQRFVDQAWWTEKQPVQTLSCVPFAIMEPYVVMRRTPRTRCTASTSSTTGTTRCSSSTSWEHRGYVFAVLTVGFGFDIPHKP